ncbi:MAG: phosphoglycerate dehydrogenase [Candidatus Eremiobacteraeota bacterium]|nr:phosphoglycerate dehydrogenase [Candidatus Eremiobacteraeota bacterium]MBV8367191.1 phosphoglycerate dehydrogenase [Candidatus Eremiobacteraeota bacterium]
MRPPTVLVAEPLAAEGVAVLRASGVEVREAFDQPADALRALLIDADGLIVRSKTKVDAEMLAAARALRVVGRAGVGVDAIDVAAATRAGIVVLNTPDASTIATAEHTIAMMLALCRHVSAGHERVRAGQWSAKGLMGGELFGKTLGIVGLGRIGAAVAARARAFGMMVIAHDSFVSEARAEAAGAKLVALDELLTRADFVTLHTPLTPQTQGLIGARELALMRSGARIINCARGGLIVEDALLDALDNGHLGGAALDVVRAEPPAADALVWRLLRHPKVAATPHLAGSTREAQARIATDLCRDVVAVLSGQPPSGSVNAPVAPSPALRPFVELAAVLGRAYAQISREPALASFSLVFEGELSDVDPRPFSAAFLVGLLSGVTDRRVSVVNAQQIADEMGISLETLAAPCERGFARALSVRGGKTALAGTIVHGEQLRLVEIDGFEIDAVPKGHMIVTRHSDVPGIVGKAGTILGTHGLNIATMNVARRDDGNALMLLAVDRAPTTAVLDELRAIAELHEARAIEL